MLLLLCHLKVIWQVEVVHHCGAVLVEVVSNLVIVIAEDFVSVFVMFVYFLFTEVSNLLRNVPPDDLHIVVSVGSALMLLCNSLVPCGLI